MYTSLTNGRHSLAALVIACYLLAGTGTALGDDNAADSTRFTLEEASLAAKTSESQASSVLATAAPPPVMAPKPELTNDPAIPGTTGDVFRAIVHLRSSSDWYRARRLGLPATKAGETGTIQLRSGTINMPIQDNTGSAQYYRLRNLVAPAGAEVTNIYCGDYEVWLFSGDVAWERRV